MDNFFSDSDFDSFAAQDTAEDQLQPGASFATEDFDAFEELQNSLPTEPGQDKLLQVSKAFNSKYQRALDSLNSKVGRNGTPSNKTLSRKAKMSYLTNIPDVELEAASDAQLDAMIYKKRVEDAAYRYPDFVSKADEKMLSQIYTNPNAINALNNSAKVRSNGLTTIQKWATSQEAGLLRIATTLDFLYNPLKDKDFDEWAAQMQILDSTTKANTVSVKGTEEWNNIWSKYEFFNEKSEETFFGIIGKAITNPELAKAAVVDAANSAYSIGLSIAGGASGAVAAAPLGVAGGPAGMLAAAGTGATLGAFTGGALAGLDEYIQNEINRDYRDSVGNIRWEALRKDFPKLQTRWQIEAAQQGITIGIVEALVPKIFSRVGKLVTPSIPKPSVLSAPTVKALQKVGKIPTEAAAGFAKEGIQESVGATTAKTMIDFQNGRLDKETLRGNLSEGVREGITGGIIGAAGGAAKVPAQAAFNASINRFAKRKASKFTEKPSNEFNRQDTFDAEYEVRSSEEVVERLAITEQDSITSDSLEGMTDAEKIALIDAANTIDTEMENGQIVPEAPKSVAVNGTDINTLLGDDASVILETLSPGRREELSNAITSGEDFSFTYGEWTVAAGKLKDKYPSVFHLEIDAETGMAGYEAVEVLSEAYDELQRIADTFEAPNLESLPPSTPGISAEVTQEVSGEGIKPRGQTSVLAKVHPTGNINTIELELADGSRHTIDLYKKENPLEIQGLVDTLTDQFTKALKKSGRNSQEVIAASVAGIPLMVRTLIKRADALGVPLSDMSKSIRFKSDQSHGSAYISVDLNDPSKVVYGVGKAPQQISTVIHEFAHAILNFMLADVEVLEQKLINGTITKEGIEYLDTIKSMARLLGITDIREVKSQDRMSLIDPATGKVQNTTQSRRPLTKFTVLHEKLATTMETYLKIGKLETSQMEEDLANTLMYWRALIPDDITNRLASEAAVKGWKYSGEYHQALDPTEEVGRVFHDMYSVNQTMDTKAVPMFNMTFFPVEMLGAQGQILVDKIAEVKHTAIAKVFAKLYADSINARTKLNSPEVIDQMNQELYSFFSQTNAGQVIGALNSLGLEIPADWGISGIQKFAAKYDPDFVEFKRLATEDDVANVMNDFPDILTDTDYSGALASIKDTFDLGKENIQEDKLIELGYMSDEKTKSVVEAALAKHIPAILEEQFTQLVAKYPKEAKALFAAYMKKGRVSSRVAAKQITVAATKQLDTLLVNEVMDAKKGTFRAGRFSNKANTSIKESVALFEQGRYLEGLDKVFEAHVKAEMMRLAEPLAQKLKGYLSAIDTFSSMDYIVANPRKVHPEISMHLGKVLDAFKEGQVPPKLTLNIVDPLIVKLVNDMTDRAQADLSGKNFTSVGATVILGGYARAVNEISKSAMKSENDLRADLRNEKIIDAKYDVLASDKVIDLRSRLPQLNTVHEVFSMYYPTEKAFLASPLYTDIIYPVIQGESKTTNEFEAMGREQYKFAEPALKKPFEPMKLPLSGIVVGNRSELLSVIMLMGSESGMETLLRTHKAYDIDPTTNTIMYRDSELMEDIETLAKMGEITQADVDYVNKMWEDFKYLHGLVKRVYRRDRGVAIGEVGAKPFTLGGFKFDGGYFPLSYSEDVAKGEKATDTFSFYDVYGFHTFRRTKQRGKGKSTPVKLGLNSVPAYIQTALKEFHIKPPMEIFKAFVYDPEVKEHIEKTRPGAFESPIRGVQMGIIDDWIHDVENQFRPDLDPRIPSIVTSLIRNTNTVFYAFNPVTALTNLAGGLPVAAPLVDSQMRLAYHAITGVLTLGKFKQVEVKSEIIKSNTADFIKWVNDNDPEVLFSSYTKREAFLQKSSLMFLRASQWYMERAVWLAEYESQIAKKASEADAIKVADATVRRAYGSYAISSKSIGQKHGVLSAFTDKATMHIAAFKRQTGTEIKRDSPLWRRMYMGALLDMAFAASIIGTLGVFKVMSPTNPDGDEEEENKKLALMFATEMVGAKFGLYGRILTQMINPLAIGSKVTLTPVENVLNKSMQVAKLSPLVLQTEYPLTSRDWASIADVFSLFTGKPLFSGAGNLYQAGEAIFVPSEELYQSRHEEDYARRYYRRQLE